MNLGYDSECEGESIYDEMNSVVLGVVTGQYEENDGSKREKLACTSVHLSGINLFPMCEPTCFAFVKCLKRCPLGVD